MMYASTDAYHIVLKLLDKKVNFVLCFVNFVSIFFQKFGIYILLKFHFDYKASYFLLQR